MGVNSLPIQYLYVLWVVKGKQNCLVLCNISNSLNVMLCRLEFSFTLCRMWVDMQIVILWQVAMPWPSSTTIQRPHYHWDVCCSLKWFCCTDGECACQCLYSNNTMEWAVCFVFIVMSLWPAAPRMQNQCNFSMSYTGDQGISQSLCGLLMAQNINVSAMCDSHCTSGSFLGMCVNFLSMPR